MSVLGLAVSIVPIEKLRAMTSLLFNGGGTVNQMYICQTNHLVLILKVFSLSNKSINLTFCELLYGNHLGPMGLHKDNVCE